MVESLKLGAFKFDALFLPENLCQFDKQFLDYLKTNNPQLEQQLLAYRAQTLNAEPKQVSLFLIELAQYVESFLIELFAIEAEIERQRLLILSSDPIFIFKQWFVKREGRRRIKQQDALLPFSGLDHWVKSSVDCRQDDFELVVATWAKCLLDNQNDLEAIDHLIQWCVYGLTDKKAKDQVANWVSFQLPESLNYQYLVKHQQFNNDNLDYFCSENEDLRPRDGFDLTDEGMSKRQVMDQVHYCIYCHNNEGDFCSKGFPVKKQQPELGFKENPLGQLLTGCPLEEKISEMHWLKRHGYSLAALAMVMVDNPLCPLTGHRICNDCMKSCIFQKQEPVDIPQIETHVLKDVLALPWGVEIYDLLCRWNPLRQEQWVAKPYIGKKVLVMGMGPSGMTLAHHLLMEGCAVVGVDGLKIEPLDKKYLTQPIKSYDTIKQNLSDRVVDGFGGVAEYGITPRWDKNYLKLIYISLMRRPHFQVFGGVRFGGTLTVDDVWRLNFDHLAIAVGAGLPRELRIPGSLAPGMRQANDFLMALQLTGAGKMNSLANLQIRMPIVVIGGGLTAIDTATESQAYYIVQVEKLYQRYQKLSTWVGEARVRSQFSSLDLTILVEMLVHGEQVAIERKKAKKQKRQADFIHLIRQWGGVTVVYRRRLQDCPAYRLNHHELAKAFEEGLYFLEQVAPAAVQLDVSGQTKALAGVKQSFDEDGEWISSDEKVVIPARSILVATGAKPNVAYEFEHQGTFEKKQGNYQTYMDVDGKLTLMPLQKPINCKSAEVGSFTSYHHDEHKVTFVGDTHPVFHGSVVKAMASAKLTYPKIINHLCQQKSQVLLGDYQQFSQAIQQQFMVKVIAIHRHSPSVVELVIHAPIAVDNFKPGHFYRLQMFESVAKTLKGTTIQAEGVALLGTKVNRQQQTLSLMVIEEGVSSRILGKLSVDDPVALMGPTGVHIKIPSEPETVMIVGGRLSIAYLLAVGPALKAAGHRVLFILNLKTADELFCQSDIEDAADYIVWVTNDGQRIEPQRPNDLSASGALVDVISQYAQHKLAKKSPINIGQIDRVLICGSYPLLAMLKPAFQSLFKNYCKKKQPKQIASVYGPMQCMLKGVCAQCLQWQIDPQTGQRTKAVYSCSWQNQPLEMIDLTNLADRLSQNNMQETLTSLWYDYCQ